MLLLSLVGEKETEQVVDCRKRMCMCYTYCTGLSLSFCWSRSNKRLSNENGDDRGPKLPEENPSTSKKEDDNTATLTRTPDDNPSCSCRVFPIIFCFFFPLTLLFFPTHSSIHEPTTLELYYIYTTTLGDESGRQTDYSDSSQ